MWAISRIQHKVDAWGMWSARYGVPLPDPDGSTEPEARPCRWCAGGVDAAVPRVRGIALDGAETCIAGTRLSRRAGGRRNGRVCVRMCADSCAKGLHRAAASTCNFYIHVELTMTMRGFTCMDVCAVVSCTADGMSRGVHPPRGPRLLQDFYNLEDLRVGRHGEVRIGVFETMTTGVRGEG